MMKYAINKNSILAVRTAPSESSEMISQLLFGEFCQVQNEENRFSQIKNHANNLEGWVETNSLIGLSKEEYDALVAQPIYRTSELIVDIFNLKNKSMHKLVMGSFLPNYDPETSRITLGESIYQIHSSFVSLIPSQNAEGIAPTAKAFINTPKLHGGKSALGIDADQFIKLVYAQNGYILDSTGRYLTDVSINDVRGGDILILDDQGIATKGIAMDRDSALFLSSHIQLGLIEKDTKTLNGENETLKIIEIGRVT